ncbi:MAG: phosphoribosyltransferase [Gammaproteobacteria bacterium]|nr:phosphoribosyltransferase [Gammaproteobacteria bacterium]
MQLPFADRASAGMALARALEPWRSAEGLLVLALPRGGVPVAFEVAVALDADLDLMLVRKLGTPGNPELAMGAIVAGDVRILNAEIIDALAIPTQAIDAEVARETRELARRTQVYRGDRALPTVAGRTLILIDDGIATGATMRAAVAALRSQRPLEIVVAVPVAPLDSIAQLRHEADAVVCLATPEHFGAIGYFYRNFTQVTDDEVRALLARTWHGQPPSAA